MLPSTAAGLIGATLLPGCAAWTEAGRLPVESMQQYSAARIGCLSTEIAISNENHELPGMFTAEWIATCRGREFACSRTARGGSGHVAVCQERLSAAGDGAPAQDTSGSVEGTVRSGTEG
jgi:hypothetical protein